MHQTGPERQIVPGAPASHAPASRARTPARAVADTASELSATKPSSDDGATQPARLQWLQRLPRTRASSPSSMTACFGRGSASKATSRRTLSPGLGGARGCSQRDGVFSDAGTMGVRRQTIDVKTHLTHRGRRLVTFGRTGPESCGPERAVLQRGRLRQAAGSGRPSSRREFSRPRSSTKGTALSCFAGSLPNRSRCSRAVRSACGGCRRPSLRGDAESFAVRSHSNQPRRILDHLENSVQRRSASASERRKPENRRVRSRPSSRSARRRSTQKYVARFPPGSPCSTKPNSFTEEAALAVAQHLSPLSTHWLTGSYHHEGSTAGRYSPCHQALRLRRGVRIEMSRQPSVSFFSFA